MFNCLFKSEGSVWLGLKRTSKKKEFKWADSTAVSWTHWSNNSPSKNEHCVVTRKDHDLDWKSMSCTETRAVVCQYNGSSDEAAVKIVTTGTIHLNPFD